MKIGVYLGDLPAHEGGGFTFQWDVLQALIEFQGPSRHSFVIYSSLTQSPAASANGHHMEFERTHSEKWRKIRLWSQFGLNSLAPILHRIGRQGWFERSLRKHSVEMMWFVTPAFYPVDIPYVYTIWDLQHRLQPWFPEVSSQGRWEFRETYFQHALKRAVAVITPNDVGRDEAVQFYQVPKERVRTIPHPTPSFALNAPADANHEVLRKYDLPAKFLFYPAQFWPHKNHVTVLEAVKILKEAEHLELPVVFTGADKGNLQHIQDLIKQWGLQKQVRILGFVSQRDLVSLYRNALALTNVTFFGPENLPPLEAFALGCPVIASQVAGATEQLADAALMVDPKDPNDIAAAIRSLYRDPSLRERFIERGLQRAKEWTTKDYVRESLRLFDEFEPVRRCWATGS